MIYLDNAATSFPKPRAVRATMSDCMRRSCGNPGRSGHIMSLKAAEIIYDTREVVSAFLGLDKPERVVFTPNATYALNLAIKGLIRERCHVIISDLEHNSVTRPLTAVQKMLGGETSVFRSDIPLRESIPPLIRDDTRFIISSTVSNVIGREVDVLELQAIANEHGIGLILDLSQAVGHKAIDLSALKFAAACAPGHKGLLGPQGTGFVIFGEGYAPECIIEGGSGIDSISREMPSRLPERMEAGTLNTPSLAGLNAAIRYLQKCGLSCIERRIAENTELLRERLLSVSGIKLYSADNGIAAFNLIGIPSEELARRLDGRGICVRGGLHCSPLIHESLGTLSHGATRASVSLFTTKRQLDRLYTALKNELR